MNDQHHKVLAWLDLPDSEKAAILLAEHKGKPIEYWTESKGWIDRHKNSSGWFSGVCYRIKPEPIKGIVEYEGSHTPPYCKPGDPLFTYVIKIETLDGHIQWETAKVVAQGLP